MSTLPKSLITPEQYLELDRKAEFRSEFHNGEMFAMAGATEAHILIAQNLLIDLTRQLRPGDCRVYSHDMRVRVDASGTYLYPDLVVACGDRQFLDDRRDTLLNPTLIVEVRTPATALFDRVFKFDAYTSIPSLREYVLIVSN
jgi:Uma2 family endonuclease